jgi:GT2 family glycosyltransferase
MKVAVVILNWNGKGFLEKFLPQVIACNASFSEIIVADNASSDDSVAFLKQHYPQVRIVQNSSNGGFAKGYNDALKHIDAEYYVLLNSDVEVTRGWIEPVIKLMDSDPDIAACQPKIRSYAHREQFEYAGAAGGFIDKYTYPFCRGRIFDSYEEDRGQYDDVREIFWATGACLFIRSSVFHKAAGFDEDFFAHMEEIDLCWRIKNLGHKIMYCPHSTVFHVGGGTLSKTSPRKTYLNFRNNLVLMCKNHDPGYFTLKLLARMVLDGVAGMKFLFSGDVKHFIAVIKAHFSFYGSFGKTMAKRRALKKNIKQFTTTAIYRRSIVMDYYLRGKKKFSELEFF